MSRTLREEVMQGLPLTEREIEVMEWAAKGRMAASTGAEMGLTENTVRDYRRRAIAKLAARTLTHAVVIAVGMGYIDISEIIDEHEEGL